MTKQKIYTELKKLQRIAWQDDDLMRQETMFDLQEQLADLTLSVAQDCGMERDLVAAFPFLYRIAQN